MLLTSIARSIQDVGQDDDEETQILRKDRYFNTTRTMC